MRNKVWMFLWLVLMAQASTGSLAQGRAANFRQQVVAPLPDQGALDPAKVALGERLFHEPRLSQDDSISCASCHPLHQGGMDGRVVSIGVGGALGEFNTPTIFNAALNFRQFWDGRANSLEAQIEGPITSPNEMASSWQKVVTVLARDASYSAAFKALYADGVQRANVKDALASFERSLLTYNAPFDRYLRGEAKALSPAQLAGYQLFLRYGCIACHQGVNIGGNMYQTFGLMGDYFAAKKNLGRADLGRYNVTGNEADRHVFKVPSLRNVALTAPYFHDGSVATLREAVTIMAKYQLGRALPDEDLALLLVFLESLSGEYKGQPLP